MRGFSWIMDVVRIVWEFIVANRLEVKLLVLIGLSCLLGYLMWRRRSKTLSVIVERKFAEYKRKLGRQISLSERLSYLKYMIMVLLLPIFISGVVGTLGLWFGKEENNPQDVGRFLDTLHTCGVIVASFTAIVITVTIFAITINSVYIRKTSSLINSFLDDLAFKPLAVFAVGTIVAILVNNMITNYFDRWAIKYILWPLVVMGVLVILADLVFLLQAMKIIRRSLLSDFLIVKYKNIHRSSLLAHVKRALAQRIFAESVEKLGFLWNPYDLYKRAERAEYKVKSGGMFVNDIYFRPLIGLAKKWNLRPIERDEKQQWSMNLSNPPNIRIWPGQKLPEKEDRSAAMLVKDAEWEKIAQKMLEKAFDCRKSDRWTVSVVEWAEISHLLKTLIEDKDTEGVKSVLESFRSIAADYLENRRDIGWPHGIQTLDEDIMSPYRAPTLRNLDFLNFIRFVIRNEDEECLDEISRFLYGMAYTAFEFENAQYFDEVLIRLNWLYELSRGSQELAKSSAADVVRRYKNVGRIFDSHINKDEDNPDSYNHIFPFVQRYLKNILNAMRQAAKYADKETFQKLLENANSLLKLYVPDDVLEQYWYNYERKETELLEVQLKIRDVKLLSNLVISAWLYRGVKEGEYDIEDVKPLICIAIERVLDFHTLIETYLIVENFERHESGLGYDWWDIVEERVYEGGALSRWIEPFWVIIALRSAMSKTNVDIRKIRLLGYISEFDCQNLRSRIDSILRDEDHKWFTDIEDIGKGKECLLGVFDALAQRQRKLDYEKVVGGEIDGQAVKKFRERCVKAYEEKCALKNLLREYERDEAKVVDTSCKPLPALKLYADKENLIGEGRDTGLANICGNNIGRQETLCYAGVIEDELNEKGSIGSFKELVAKIKNEAVRLRKNGFEPQVVLIPWDHRYEQVLTDVPKWKRKCPLEFEVVPKWVTTLDRMEVFVWPHQDSKCVAVIDIGAFARFKDSADIEGGHLNISFRPLNKDEFGGFLISEVKQTGRREFKRWLRAFEYDMNKVAEMKRIVVIENMIRLELLARDSGVKLLPVEKTMGIVYGEGQTVYHLPECKIAQEIPVTERRYFTTLGLAKLAKGFQRCGRCHPHRER